MVQIKASGPIFEDGVLKLRGINGKILKIVVVTSTVYPNVEIKARLGTEEKLINDTLQDLYTIFYPRNLIPITQEQHHVECYYAYDYVVFEVRGLGDNEEISNIKVYFD